jgi:hypothetical protein
MSVGYRWRFILHSTQRTPFGTDSYAIGTGRLLELMRQAGFASVERLDGRFYQPVLVGSREE